MQKLMVISSEVLALISGGENQNATTITAKIDFHEEADHSNDYITASIGVTNPDIWDFSVNGDVNNNGSRTVGVEFTITLK